MSNPLSNWWRSWRFRRALKQGNEREAKEILQKIENFGANLSLLEQNYKKRLKAEHSLDFYKREFAAVSGRLQSLSHEGQNVQPSQEDNEKENFLIPDLEFVQFVQTSFQFVEHDEYKLQCTGIDKKTFADLEASLAEFIETEFAKVPAERLEAELAIAAEDLQKINQGRKAEYSSKLSPHIYLLTEFLNESYCLYLVWFLIYQAGLLPKNLKILDISAGVGTVAYGLALLLKSNHNFFNQAADLHISYYSQEKQSLLQLRGLQFWRKYIEHQQKSTNIFFRFDTSDILHHQEQSSKIPGHFFNFIVLAHCFFHEEEERQNSHKIYRQIIQKSLTGDGHVLLVIQDKQLFNAYNVHQTENLEQEQEIIAEFLKELGLNLEWYKYLTSTDTKIPLSSGGLEEFAAEQLPEQKHLHPLRQKYLETPYRVNYALGDYLIVAKG